MKIIGKICTLMWCLGYSGLSFGPLLIRLNFSWYIVPWYCPWNVRNYLPGLHHNVVAFSVDAVFIAVGDQATTIDHFFKQRIWAFSKVGWNHDQFNCWSVDFSKLRVPNHACVEVDSDSSWNLLANWNWSENTPVFTQKEDGMVVLPDHWSLTIEIFLT
jgi:hypothetical protein